MTAALVIYGTVAACLFFPTLFDDGIGEALAVMFLWPFFMVVLTLRGAARVWKKVIQ